MRKAISRTKTRLPALRSRPRPGDLELSRSTYQFRSLIERAGARALAEMGRDADAAEAALAAHFQQALQRLLGMV